MGEQADDRYRSMIDASTTAMFVHVGGVIRFANRAAAGLFGVEHHEELVGTHVMETVPPEWRGAFERRVADIRAGRPLLDERRPMLRRDGTEIIVAVHAARTEWDGEPAVQVEVRDVTLRARAEEELVTINRELEQAVAIKDHVLSMASHDMRNPITSILGFAAVLRTQLHDPRLVETALDSIERQAMRLEHLVGDLLSLAVIDGGAIAIEPTVVTVAPLIAQAVSETPGGQSCRIDVGDDVVVWADPDRLVQILGNLLTNAVKYGAEPFDITAAARDADWVELRVCDRGPGVAAEHVDELFERFSPASRRAAHARRGTGLGLAIVRALAQLQGGDAWYEPRDPVGACFGVRLPARQPVLAVEPEGMER